MALKVVVVAMRGSDYGDFASKILVFWKGGCLQEVVAQGGSSVFNFFLILKFFFVFVFTGSRIL